MDTVSSAGSSSSITTGADSRGGGSGAGSEFLGLGGTSAGMGMFTGTSGVKDLLLGSGGFSNSLGNGYNAELAGSSGAPTTSSTAPSTIDLADFPTLGGVSSGVGSNNSSNGLAAALQRQQHQQQQQQQHQQHNNQTRDEHPFLILVKWQSERDKQFIKRLYKQLRL
mmetsp:Transcript_27117/g.41615  ORF Transcript_27117/g.41615 Transcript_27117/m.41615 type:complete len:167 (+) Transcript_27117:91-591(+)